MKIFVRRPYSRNHCHRVFSITTNCVPTATYFVTLRWHRSLACGNMGCVVSPVWAISAAAVMLSVRHRGCLGVPWPSGLDVLLRQIFDSCTSYCLS